MDDTCGVRISRVLSLLHGTHEASEVGVRVAHGSGDGPTNLARILRASTRSEWPRMSVVHPNDHCIGKDVNASIVVFCIISRDRWEWNGAKDCVFTTELRVDFQENILHK